MVIEVIAVSACPPMADIVLISCCIPVPPVLSEPVMVNIGVNVFMKAKVHFFLIE
jgi:hypothetical protein